MIEQASDSGDDNTGLCGLKAAWRGLGQPWLQCKHDPVSKHMGNTVCNHSESHK